LTPYPHHHPRQTAMLLYHGPQITLLRSDTTNASTLGSTPCQMELRKGGCRLYSYHITTDPTEDLTPLPGTGSNNKTPLSILRTAAGRGHNKKVVMHSLAVGSFFGACALHGKQYQWEMRVCHIQPLFLSRRFVVGFFYSLLCLPTFLPSTTKSFLGGGRRGFMRGSRLDPNARENDCMGRWDMGVLSVCGCALLYDYVWFDLGCGVKC
jgi:hypothetical protein